MPATEFTIADLPKGAEKQPEDPRDLNAAFVMGAPVVDWSNYHHLPDPGNEDQGSSLSCVSQSFSYYHRQIHGLDWSRRDLYSRIFLPQGGAFLRSGASELTSRGQATRQSVPDPNPETELSMRDSTGATADLERIGQEANYFSIDGKNIDAVAAAVLNYKGCVFGLYGTNAGWADLANPRPPRDGDPGTIWGHALYCVGFHMHNGQKCIIAKSSWCNTGVLEHHIKEDYFQTGNTFDAWTLIPKELQPMYFRFLVFDANSGRLGVLVVGQTGFSDAILWADSQTHLTQLKALYQVPANALTITIPKV